MSMNSDGISVKSTDDGQIYNEVLDFVLFTSRGSVQYKNVLLRIYGKSYFYIRSLSLTCNLLHFEHIWIDKLVFACEYF